MSLQDFLSRFGPALQAEPLPELEDSLGPLGER